MSNWEYSQVSRAVRLNGYVIVATFAADGPTRCSGHGTCRYGPEESREEFGHSFDLIAHLREEHVTPSGARQWFVYCLFYEYRPAQSAAA